MRWRSSIITIFMFIASSCMSASETQLTPDMLRTSAVVPTLTATLASMSIVTPFPTPSSTKTVQPSRTPTPRATERALPTVTHFFIADFDTNGTGGLENFGRAAVEGVPGNSSTSFFEIVQDPTKSGRGNVYQAIVTGPTELSAHRPYPDVAFPRREGSFSTELDVYLDIDPETRLDLYDHWLSVLSIFDYGAPQWHPSIMVSVVGSSGKFQLRTRSIDQAHEVTELTNLPGAPVLKLNTWIRIRVDVDVQEKTVWTYQDGVLVSEGPYTAGTTWIEFAHWGLYGTIRKGVLLNDNITLGTFQSAP